MTTIKFRRDTSANWTSVNPIPAQGEPCYETDTGKLKIGNGSDNYVTLPYVSDSGGGSAPTNMVTTDTDQTISGSKAFSATSNFNGGCNFNSRSYSDNYFVKGLKIGDVHIYNESMNTLCVGGSSAHFLKFDDDNIKFMSGSSPGMSINNGVITAAYNKPYLKIKEHNDNTNTHNLEISCDTTNNNNWSIACGDQTFINTANIDTTYMKWDSTSKKLKVDTAAVAHLAMPSNKYIDLTLGASGTQYTAPADGWVSFQDTANQPNSALVLKTSLYRVASTPGSSGNPVMSLIMPVAKDAVFFAEYEYTTGEDRLFRFIYAAGSEPN